VSDIQRESQTILNSIKENNFHIAPEVWEKQWDRCIRSQGDILMKMAAKIEYVKPAFFLT
jgi:hypothetical protein